MFAPFISAVIGRNSGVSTTWDPLNKGSNIVLSDGNLTATQSVTSTQMVKATISKDTGSFIFEVVITNFVTGLRVGLAQAVAQLNVSLGSETGGVAIGYQTTAITYNGGNVQTGLGALATGVSIKVLFDGANVSFYRNDVLQGTPVNIGAGPWIPAVSFTTINAATTANFAPSLPSGVSAGSWG